MGKKKIATDFQLDVLCPGDGLELACLLFGNGVQLHLG